MSSTSLLVTNRKTFGSDVHIHLLGIWIFLSCATFPTVIKTIKMIGVFPLKLSDIILVAIFVASFAKRKDSLDKLTKVNIVVLILLPAVQGLVKGASAFHFLNEISSVFYLFFAYAQFRSVESYKEVKIICRYVLVTLIISVLFSLLILSGLLEYSERLRVSFEYGEATNLGRLVTNTLSLAAVSLSISLTLLIRRKIRTILFLAYFMPSFLITSFASTRFVTVFIFIPIVFLFFAKRFGNNKASILKILGTTSFALVVLTVWQETILNTNSAYNYIVNSIIRTLVFFSSFQERIDNSSLYRLIEFQEAYRAFLQRPLTGYGFGIEYTSAFYNGGSSDWLTIYGTTFIHSTYSWVAIKSGVFGLLLFIIWILNKMKRISNPNQIVLALFPCLISILLVGIVWNFIGLSGEATVYGMLIGLANCRWFPLDEN